MNCPACQQHNILPYAWMPTLGGTYKDNNYYECANCGPLPKEFVDLIVKHIKKLERQT